MILETPAVVLARELLGDQFLKCHFYSLEQGYFMALKRVSAKKASGNLPDLFQTAELVVERNRPDKPWFLSHYAIEKDRLKIASRFENYDRACRFCRVWLHNAGHMDVSSELYALLNRCLDAWEREVDAEVVYIKGLYSWAKAEGYPVREDWLSRLTGTLLGCAEEVLFRSLSEQGVADAECGELGRSLERWLELSAGFRMES